MSPIWYAFLMGDGVGGGWVNKETATFFWSISISSLSSIKQGKGGMIKMVFTLNIQTLDLLTIFV